MGRKESHKKSSRKPKKKSRQSRGWGQSTRHHIISRTVGGPDIPENIYKWPKDKHQAYHWLFRNYLPFIVIQRIKEWMDEEGNLNIKKMGEEEFKYWKRVFNNQKPADVIRFIEENFLPVEEKFLKGELGRREND